MTEAINGLIWILERLHVTPSTTALWVLFGLGLVSLVIASTSYIVKRLQLARAKKGNIVPAIGMIITAGAFVIFLIWDIVENGSVMKAEKTTQGASLPP